jgi:hypothetical protein
MKKKKFTPELLKEEAKRFRLLSEYDFYQETKELPEYKDLLLGDKLAEEEGDAPADLEPADDAEKAGDAIGDELGVSADGEEEMTGDIPEPDMDAEEPEVAPEPELAPEPASDDVEVDVTSLVKGSEDAKHSADVASHNSEILLHKLSDLENKLNQMTQVSAKIEDLEKEIIKRNPTPVEKLEMRSLSSYPYSQKLTDYWADKEGAYNVMGDDKKKKEYVLTKQDVDDFSEREIKNSFNPSFEEEDINDYTEE